MNSTFFAVWLWSSKQKRERPALSSLRLTTSNAAIFSLTNRTVLPADSISAIMFAIVWLFPVPGGPSTTRFFPAFASRMTASWDESASTMLKQSPDASGRSSVSAGASVGWKMESINGLSSIAKSSPQLAGSRSLNITYFLKLKRSSTTSGQSVQPFSLMISSTDSKNALTSAALSGCPKSGSSIPCSANLAESDKETTGSSPDQRRV